MNKNVPRTASGNYAGIALFILCFSYFVPNYAQYQVSPLGAAVMEQFGLTTGQLSSLFSAPMIPAIFLSLISGLLIDKIGPRLIIGVGILIAAVGCILRIWAGDFFLLMIATAMTGFAACFINAGGAKILSGFFGPEKVNGKMGILMAASKAGMTVSMFTSARFSTVNNAFFAAAVLAVISVIVWFLFMRNPTASLETEAFTEKLPSMKECLQTVCRSKNTWLVSFAMFFIMAANVIFSSFTPTALTIRGIDSITAGNLGAFITIGNFLGCFAAPFCIRRLRSQKKVLVLFGILAAIGVAFAWKTPTTILLAAALLFTGMFIGGMIPSLMALPVQFSDIGPVYARTAGGVIGTIQVLGAVLVPSYVIAPIAGDSYLLLYLLGGLCMVTAGILAALIKDIS